MTALRRLTSRHREDDELRPEIEAKRRTVQLYGTIDFNESSRVITQVDSIVLSRKKNGTT